METHLLNASLYSRSSLYLILDYLTVKSYSREFAILISKIKEYYERDKDAPAVNRELFLALLQESISNPKHFERFKLLIEEAYLQDSSVNNVNELIVKAKLHEVGMRLSTALANNEDDKAAELLAEYQQLKTITTIEELDAEGIDVYTAEDLATIIEHAQTGENQLKVYPLALAERLENRAGPQHHITAFARPEIGKTALSLTISGGFARQDAPGIYFGNEDAMHDVYVRQVSNLTGMTRLQILSDRKRAESLAMENGLDNIRFVSLSPGNPRQVEAFIDKFRPKWFIMDQARNLDMKETNKVLQLEKSVQFCRKMAKKYHTLAVSIVQAGDSAEGKRNLEMGDVDYSNTGVPGACDVLLGLGASPDDLEKGVRFINLSKNKISGRHESFPVKLYPHLSRYSSISEAT